MTTHDLARPGTAIFRTLHQPGNPFILANAWDIGTARVLVGLGAQAIATSSAAHAFTLGRRDGAVDRQEALEHAAALVDAVDVPVSGDFENGFGHDPDECARTVALAAEVGLAGISIEDTRLPDPDPYDFGLAVERVAAAAIAAREQDDDMVLIARADGVMLGTYDLDEAIRRVRSFEAAGADGVYVPMPGTVDDLRAVCQAVSVPVNALAAGPFTALTRADFAALGVARISLGSALARAAQSLVYRAGEAMFDDGVFELLAPDVAGKSIDEWLDGPSSVAE